MKRLLSVLIMGLALVAVTACTPEAIATELDEQACWPNCGDIPPPPPPPPPTNTGGSGGD